ncbi:aminotransferase [Amycolatopsis mediterranei S699]|uniref:alanine--glyoxylate transaminase n=2 Tax=Amycolatopsis mediterranei TaxID=33910 RepID=A0A0H3CVE7_AMYMU|nr:aspartate aminotransferase family protein [Amycolatopsis mediterranei]ADJ42015.1 aminotransferase [Amycolatopsis mediterranei U32]AEK38690.1 aminotransferase class-III [Amycolatopsis mediterranei S699]AFO73725.1 aminotransferase [Amycolatopsis mediterranei S699]AGT80854.1 aminotransferase [Amycolatopsis mediterranei RB]KDO08847.1 aminotransferase class III [Amycolatopsis mediterranei]
MTDELLARHRAVMPSWMSLLYEEPIEIVHAHDRRMTDSQGRTYLDFFAGVLTNSMGYDVAEIGDAVRKQLDTGILHTSTLYLIRSQVELAERIAKLSNIPDAKVFFTNSGSEANDTALMLATQYRRSNQVLAMRNSYHGRSFATVAITGNRGWSASSLSPVKVSYVHGGYRYRSPFRTMSDADYIDACVADLVDVLDTATAGDVACLIAEPIQGVGGFSLPPDGLFRAMKEVLDEYGVLFISDEVQTGWGRTGEHFWGIEAHGVTPDMMTFAKGLGNGLAVGGVVARGDVLDCFQAQSFSTFGGNPVSMAGATAVLDYIKDHDLQANCAARGAQLLSGLRAAESPIVAEVRGKGLMIGVELIKPGTTEPFVAAAARMLEETKKRGLLIGKGGLHGNVLRLGPPMTLTAEEAQEGLDILVDALAATHAALS